MNRHPVKTLSCTSAKDSWTPDICSLRIADIHDAASRFRTAADSVAIRSMYTGTGRDQDAEV